MTKEDFLKLKRLETDIKELSWLKDMLDNGSVTITSRKNKKHPFYLTRESECFEPIKQVVAQHLKNLQHKFDRIKFSLDD